MSLFKKYGNFKKARTKSSSAGTLLETDTDAFRKTTSKIVSTSSIVATYMKSYMTPNVLYLIWNQYIEYEKAFSIFDTIYEQVSFSSHFCSLLWLKAEHIRVLFTMSMEHKVENEECLLPMNEELLCKEYKMMKQCYLLLTKIISEMLEFLCWNKSLRWERRFQLEQMEQVYKSQWTELNSWLDAIKNLASPSQIQDTEAKMTSLEQDSVEKLIELNETIDMVPMNTKAIKKLNEQTAKCIKLNIYLQYAEAQTLASYLYRVEEIEKFYVTYKKTSNQGAQAIIKNAKQVLEESSHKAALVTKNKLDFQANRVPNIGPFGLVPIPADMVQAFSVSTEYKMWRLNRDFCTCIKGFEGIIEGVTGMTTSRVSGVPFSIPELEVMNVPAMAVKWCYMPALEITEGMNIELMKKYAEGRSPVHMLVLNGGFAFFDVDKALVSLHALERGTDLFFTFPLFRNLQIRQYRFKDDLLHYERFPIEPRIKEAGHTGLFAVPADWTPDDPEDEEESDPKWAFVFKDTVEEETDWPHYAFELCQLPLSVIEAKGKKYRASPELKRVKRAFDRSRDFWALSFPPLYLKSKKYSRLQNNSSSFISPIPTIRL